ncbi:MAG: PepSY domain-containing protein [Ramlibacter sp.]|nr:PepSY domain-containing protein [Ramlibacter sp.]
MNTKHLIALAALAPVLAFAGGDFKCDVPKAEWQPQTALKAKLEKDGWKKVRQVKIEHGCYEVYGFDENNKRAEKFYNPKTFEQVGAVKQP